MIYLYGRTHVDLYVSSWFFFFFFFCVGDVYLTSGFILSQSPFINMKHWHILKTYKYSLHYRQEVWILKVEKRVSWLVLYMIWNFDIFAELIHKKQNDSELLNQNILNMWLITLFRRDSLWHLSYKKEDFDNRYNHRGIYIL